MRLLLLAAAGRALLAPPAGDIAALVPATFEGVAVVVPLFAELGPAASYAAFLASLGLGGVPQFRREYLDARKRALGGGVDPLVAELAALPRPAAPLRAAVAVAVADRSLLAEWRGDDAPEAVAADLVARARETVELNATVAADVVAAVAAQLRVRRAARDRQADAFAAAPPLPRDPAAATTPLPPPSTSTSLFARVRTAAAADGALPTFLLNLAASHGRRAHARRQLERAGLLAETRWVSAVDGSALASRVVGAAVREGAVLSQGEVGIWLSHLTAWQDVAEAGLPYALVVEDDVTLAADARAVACRAVAALGETPWDILALDLGLPGHVRVGLEPTRPDVAGRCHAAAAAAAAAGEAVARLDGGCSHSSIGGYVISWRGARALSERALPASKPVDTFLENEIRRGGLDAFAALPPVAHVDGRNTSDSVRRYLRVDGPHVHYTFRQNDETLPTCFDTPCQITVAPLFRTNF